MKAIVCCGINNEIGKDNKVLFKFKEDLCVFRNVTKGFGKEPCAVIMGRKTFDSIGKALPSRLNIILTTHPDQYNFYNSDNVVVVRTIDEAYAICKDRFISSNNMYLIGGGQVYNDMINICTHVIITRVFKEVPDADTFFPSLTNRFKLTQQSEQMHSVTDAGEEIDFCMQLYRNVNI